MSKMEISTISSPEFVNLTQSEYSPFVSKCNIKVLYVGKNRNGSFIDKATATEMSKTLRGCPIVGYYKSDKGDFADHGQVMTIDDEGVHFECKTVPYGFVPPDANVWFQLYEETDVFGNKEIREYLMTEGLLWTHQFEEAQLAATDEGRPQSMELDGDSLDGYWQFDKESGMEFFIINDATFSKLCILGEDVEPCFEGANVAAPVSETTTSFSLDKDFKNTLYSMMQDLKQILSEGGKMAKEVKDTLDFVEATEVVENEVFENQEPTSAETEQFEAKQEEEKDEEFAKAEEEKKAEEEFTVQEEPVEEFAKEDEEEEEEDSESDEEAPADEEEKDKEKKDYALLETQFAELQEKYEALEAENASLKEFKLSVENEKKDALIASFYMLSDEEKADVIKNKAQYSLDEIEAKLSVICVRKHVNFDEDTEDEVAPVTYALEETSSIPAWIQAVKNVK